MKMIAITTLAIETSQAASGMSDQLHYHNDEDYDHQQTN
jgi:hypothetical protein